ncbi:hypothetical protein MM326_19275 [Alkalihalobacillus sp. LMS6]|uniref:hypothetical protein n=1 Tax=Alkalihalobacillus sp. LMS6 TaxID=2924034 RepID=UPI0020D01017|nr:hypothetical protein [Alkalihalobacillus sp. LMS6]UTR06189.1 hypothetical protein MM326_19275 [Alkalihalobacillus sp. LMS6]
MGIYRKIGYGFICLLILTFLVNFIALFAGGASNPVFMGWLMAVLMSSAGLAIFFLSLDHYQKTDKEKKSQRAFLFMTAISVLFIGLAAYEVIAINNY